MTVKGIDKQLVGEAAARIRSYYPAEPYKGKGIKYVGEHIRRKQGKKVAESRAQGAKVCSIAKFSVRSAICASVSA